MQFARKTRLLAREKQPLPSAPARPRHLPPIHRILGPLADVMVAVFEEEGAAIEHRALSARDLFELMVGQGVLAARTGNLLQLVDGKIVAAAAAQFDHGSEARRLRRGLRLEFLVPLQILGKTLGIRDRHGRPLT